MFRNFLDWFDKMLKTAAKTLRGYAKGEIGCTQRMVIF